MNVNRILFPTDFSDSSDAALSYASSLAAETGATLYIVHVGDESAAYLTGYGGFGSVPDAAERVARENQALLNQVKPTVADVSYRRCYLNGSPDHEILKLAESEKIDLIVLGSHGRTGISRLLLGSVAEAIVRGAKCPVLTVKQPLSSAAEDDGHEVELPRQHPEPITKHSLH